MQLVALIASIKCLVVILKFEIVTSIEETYVTDGDLVRYRTCVRNYRQKYPTVNDRFNDFQLTSTCKRENEWYQYIVDHKNDTDLIKYTDKQQKYVRRIQQCRDYFDCYSDTMPVRNYSAISKSRLKRQAGRPALRRECRTLSQQELNVYFDTLNRLKNSEIDGINKYDLLINWHLPSAAPEAHFGPAFLPYHRELLKQLEVAGRRENPSFALCYWDSTLDRDLPRAADSVLWMDNFFGNGNGRVTTGPFANWGTTSMTPGSNDLRLFRLVGRSPASGLYNTADLNGLLAKNTYEEFCSYCVDPTFELLHAGIHDFVGGYMTYINQSPNDPVFFNHHTFVDYFWEIWRQSRQSRDERETDYPPNGPAACGIQHYAQSPMSPFRIQNIDGLSTSYNSLAEYEESPTCSNGLCTGDFLFCNQRTGRCMSKVRPGGVCIGLQGMDSCYRSVCNGQTCSQSTGQQEPQQSRGGFQQSQRLAPGSRTGAGQWSGSRSRNVGWWR